MRGRQPEASDSTPTMKGPAARPNRFWNSASTEAPVARTPGWMTSITIADTGPTLQVIRKPPSAISANCVDRLKAGRAGGSEGRQQHQHRGNAQRGHDEQLVAWAARRRRGRPCCPRTRCRPRPAARPGRPAPPPGRARGRGSGSGSSAATTRRPTPRPAARRRPGRPRASCATGPATSRRRRRCCAVERVAWFSAGVSATVL